MHNSVIDIEHLNLYYGKQHILKDINISIPAKKITVILGPSGCGKTTLLRSLNRLTELDASVKMSGKIFLNGQDLLSSKEDSKKDGFACTTSVSLANEHLQQCCIRTQNQRPAKEKIPQQSGGILPEANQFVGRSEGSPERTCCNFINWPAAKALPGTRIGC